MRSSASRPDSACGCRTDPSHLTAIVTVFEVALPIERTTGIAELGVTPAGTCTLTWYSPTVPGASPEKSTVAGNPPIITVGLVVVAEGVVFDAALPLAGEFVTGPSPVQ
jgi:hypothetical protein